VDVLDGVRVIDLTMWAFVPAAGGVLAHWGADVIKIEPPGSPDPMRLLGGTLEPGGSSWFFKHYSRGKRAIALDLKTEAGRDVLYRLAESADVFLTSFLPRTRQKLQFDVEHIRAVNPRIVYVRGSGQGPQGPDAARGGYDTAAYWSRGSLAYSGQMAAGLDRPLSAVGHGDGMSGLVLAGGICAALLKRAMTGETSVVDASLMGTAIWHNGPAIISSQFGEDVMAVPTRRHPTNTMYRTRDGRFIITVMLGDFDDEWADFCKHLGRPDMATDPRFATADSRVANADEAVATFDEIFAGENLEHWKAALATTKGVWAPVQTPAETHDDPQTIANGFIRDVAYQTGTVRLPVPPILFDEEAGDPPLAPDFAQHTDEVLAEIGYDEREISGLRDAGVIA
jgi:crotonobetainyl-CoA:carnitine CoA-transferase CaiB-like acyl-CoA transferase